jgi:hypothetical protein
MKISENVKLETLEDFIKFAKESLEHDHVSHGGTGNDGHPLDEDQLLCNFEKNIKKYKPGLKKIIDKAIGNHGN